MDGPFHRVGLKVTSLRWSGTGNDQIPENLDYSDGASRECDIDTDHSSEYLDEARNCSQDDSQEDFETTQGRKDAADKRILQKMLEPSSVDTSMIPTQGLSNPAAKENALAAKPKLSQIRVSEIERERNQLSTIRLTDTKSNGSHSNNRFGGAINCQCGFDKEEEYMHLACYGFLDLQDPRLPDTHACYRCLLEPGEKELLREMSTLVLLRRALKVIMEEGYPNRTKVFAEKLHCNGQTIVQITELLKKRGLLKATPGYKSKGFAEKGLPSFVIPEAQDVHETIDQEIFNPLAKISHHYILPQASHSASSEEHHQRSEYGREFHPVFGTYRERSRRRLWPLDEGICRSREASTASASSSPKVERQAFMSGRRQNQGRKRKLSNAAQPLDVGEHDDELMDASSS
ncbi:hypothetical protein PRK78_006148 [Emydomyces testavorans]|uniref:Uncharacterized protein n=1 Tax=Emydomyces testavorans TaxID=2070801 RepID=A0AAF0DKU8_9EURO|nr:hypothetical protein PRK78_006148 [Emydomyces testavorans]